MGRAKQLVSKRNPSELTKSPEQEMLGGSFQVFLLGFGFNFLSKVGEKNFLFLVILIFPCATGFVTETVALPNQL